MLDNYKANIWSTLASRIDTLKTKNIQEEKNEVLLFFVLSVGKKNTLRECTLDSIQICGIGAKRDAIENCPMLPELKVVYKGETKEVEYLSYITPRRLWKLREIVMFQYFINHFP